MAFRRHTARMVARGGTEEPISRRTSVTSDALFTYGTNVAVAVLSLGNVLVVSRTLGPTGRGDVAFLTAIAWLTANLATLGVQEANANIAGTEPQRRRALATNSVIFSLAFGLITIAALGVIIALFPAVAGESEPLLRWMTFACLPIIILGIYMRFLVQADYGFGITNIAWLITPVANITSNGILAAVGALSVATAVSTWLAGQILQTVVLVVYVARRSKGFGSVDRGLARESLSFGARSHLGRVMLLGNYRLDQWIVGVAAGSRELGLYSVAVAWAEALWFLPTTLSAVQRPDLVRGGRRDAAAVAALAFRLAVIVTVFSAVAFIVAAPFLCVTVFGEEFRGSIDDLRILVLGSVGIVALKQLGSALTAQRRPTLASAAIAVAFAVAITLDLILIPRYGGEGAAIASAISYTAGGVAVSIIFARVLGVQLASLMPRRSELPMFVQTARRIARRAPSVPQP
jgi:O-antigen/teichoic acid export membrane protein